MTFKSMDAEMLGGNKGMEGMKEGDGLAEEVRSKAKQHLQKAMDVLTASGVKDPQATLQDYVEEMSGDEAEGMMGPPSHDADPDEIDQNTGKQKMMAIAILKRKNGIKES